MVTQQISEYLKDSSFYIEHGGREVNPIKIALYFHELKECGGTKADAWKYTMQYCKTTPWAFLKVWC